MTTPIKTQCPHCKACFKVQKTQLNRVNTAVSCDQCQQSFLVNKHLIVTADNPHASTAKKDASAPSVSSSSSSRPTHSSSPKKHATALSSDALIHDDMDDDAMIHDDMIYDDMIHDDMEIEDSDEHAIDDDSLDKMESWLSQASMTNVDSAHNPASSSHPSTSSQTATPPQVSSSVANDIHASIEEAEDNSWLEQLLEEESTSETPTESDTDLSQVLSSLGVPFNDKDTASQGQTNQRYASMGSQPVRYSAASLLWMIGCLVLVLLLFAQYVIFNLDTLVKNPAYAERLQAICSVAACSLPSADLTALSVTTISHQPSQIKAPSTFSEISATLNNQSTKAQLYPNLMVSVYGADGMIGTFIAEPGDYLLGKQSQLAASGRKQLLFTVPVTNAQIRDIVITPLY